MNRITAKENKIRLDVYLAGITGYTRSKVQKMIDEGLVKVNGIPEKSRYMVRVNDDIEYGELEVKLPDTKAVDIPLDIVYQDDDIAVINKQQGLVVHAGAGTDENTLVNALLFHLDKLSGINGVLRPGIVHRIDKETSGLLVVAKNDEAHVSLAKQIEKKTCRRTYVALLEGVLKQDSGRIETYIGRSDKNRTMMEVKSTGRKAVTNFRVIERFDKFTYCEFDLETGRTHQIRVHAKFLGHPIVGDKVYGYKNQKFDLEGQLLHAWKLKLKHPKTKEEMEFTAPIPDYFENILKKLKGEN